MKLWTPATADGCVHTDDTTKLSPPSCEFVFTPPTPTRQNSFVASAACIGHQMHGCTDWHRRKYGQRQQRLKTQVLIQLKKCHQLSSFAGLFGKFLHKYHIKSDHRRNQKHCSVSAAKKHGTNLCFGLRTSILQSTAGGGGTAGDDWGAGGSGRWGGNGGGKSGSGSLANGGSIMVCRLPKTFNTSYI